MKAGRLLNAPGLVALVLAVALLSQRAYVLVGNEGSRPSVLNFLLLVFIPVAVALAISSRGRSLLPLFNHQFVVLWWPYLLLAISLPIAGVAIAHNGPRSLVAEIIPVVAICGVMIGAAVRSFDARGLPAWGGLLLILAIGEALYALLQQLIVGRILPHGPWDVFLWWDIATQQTYGPNVVVGRSSGFFINPNVLGTWAAITLVAGVSSLRPPRSYIIVAAAMLAMIFSGSRGAGLALLVTLLFQFVVARRRGEPLRLRTVFPYVLVTLFVASVWLAVAGAGAPTSNLPQRAGQGISVIVGGSEPSVSARVEFWQAALQVLRAHPMGTLGSPEAVLGTSVDSEWVRDLLQGGPIFALALAWGLFGTAFRRGTDSDEWRLVRALSILIAVAGLTQLPLAYPVAVMYWAMLGGAVVAAPAARRGAYPVPGVRRLPATQRPYPADANWSARHER